MSLADRLEEAYGAFQKEYDSFTSHGYVERKVLSESLSPHLDTLRRALLFHSDINEADYHAVTSKHGLLSAKLGAQKVIDQTIASEPVRWEDLEMVCRLLHVTYYIERSHELPPEIILSNKTFRVYSKSPIRADGKDLQRILDKEKDPCLVIEGENDLASDFLQKRFGYHSAYRARTRRHIKSCLVDRRTGLVTTNGNRGGTPGERFGVGPIFMDPETLRDVIKELKGMGYRQARDDHEDLKERLISQGVPEHLIQILTESIDLEVTRLEEVITNTMTGVVNEGCVGRLSSPAQVDTYWFKVEKDSKLAYKQARIPNLVHTLAEQGIPLAQSLAERIPRVLFSEVYQGYHLTITEGANKSIIHPDPIYRRITASLPIKDETLIQRLYTTALFHELLSQYALDDPLLTERVTPLVWEKEQLIQNLNGRYSELGGLFERTIGGRRYGEDSARLEEHCSQGEILSISDNKDDNYSGISCFDFGISCQGDEVDDLARLMLGKKEYASNKQLLSEVVSSYVQIRKGLQQSFRGNVTYVPSKDLSELVHLQLQYNTWRMMGWSVKRKGPEKEFARYRDCAHAFAN